MRPGAGFETVDFVEERQVGGATVERLLGQKRSAPKESSPCGGPDEGVADSQERELSRNPAASVVDLVSLQDFYLSRGQKHIYIYVVCRHVYPPCLFLSSIVEALRRK